VVLQDVIYISIIILFALRKSICIQSFQRTARPPDLLLLLTIQSTIKTWDIGPQERTDLALGSLDWSLVSIRKTRSGQLVLRSFLRALTAEGLPNPLQFQERTFI
jgi:hypothetical protein